MPVSSTTTHTSAGLATAAWCSESANRWASQCWATTQAQRQDDQRRYDVGEHPAVLICRHRPIPPPPASTRASARVETDPEYRRKMPAHTARDNPNRVVPAI